MEAKGGIMRFSAASSSGDSSDGRSLAVVGVGRCPAEASERIRVRVRRRLRVADAEGLNFIALVMPRIVSGLYLANSTAETPPAVAITA